MPNTSKYQQPANNSSGLLTISPGNGLELIQQGTTILVDARVLHQKLKSKRQFADWVKSRIADYRFEENIDFFTNLRKTKGRDAFDYHLTLDMAKELAMLERNEVGRTVRRYFIEKEKEARQVALPMERSLFTNVPRQGINGQKVYGFTELLEKCGYKTSGHNWRRVRYPEHFVLIGSKLFTTEWYAQYLYRSRELRNIRLSLKECQPLLPFGEKEVAHV